MKDAFRSVRGTTDLFPLALARRRRVESQLSQAVKLFGYQEIETPILEHSFLFERGLGQGSEVVSKEMFRLESRTASSSEIGDDRVVLRPENTASLVRAVLHSGLQHSLPLHFFYCGPQFRYERPQRGRLREFHQFGVECYGRGSSMGDVECILSAVEGLKRVGLSSAQVTLKINTLGESEQSRLEYNKVLLDHFLNWKNGELSPETMARISEKRVLRALDSKSKLDLNCIANAPKLIDFLPKSDVDRFQEVVSILVENYKIENLEIDPRLVRGLDYYSHTCFEFVSKRDDLTCLAGGRYNNLAKILGYDKFPLPAIGWAAGLERLVLLVEEVEKSKTKVEEGDQLVNHAELLIVQLPDLHSTEMNVKIKQTVAEIASRARSEGISTRIYGGLTSNSEKNPMKRALKEADQTKAIKVCMVGASEVESKRIPVRNVQSGEVQAHDLNSSVKKWLELSLGAGPKAS